MEIEIRKKGRDVMPIRDTLSILKQNFEQNPYFKFFLIFAGDSDALGGYMALVIHPEKELKTIHLYRIWHDGAKEVMEQLKEIIRQIAKENKCKRLTIEVYNNEKALERSYGFKKSSVLMERRI